MPSLEKIFQKLHITDFRDCDQKDFSVVPESCHLSLLGKGFFSRAFLVKDTKWVIKEGRWDIDIPTIFGTKSIHWQPIQKLLQPFSYTFLPTKEEVERQYREYLLFARYFGYFDENYTHYDEFQDICDFQHWFRKNLSTFVDIVEHRFKVGKKEFIHILPWEHNFLPKEYMCYGTAISKENKKKQTSYIVQEFMEWQPLVDVDISKLNRDEITQIYFLCLLILIFYQHTGKVPDTRPSSDMKNWWQWLMKTENIFLTSSGVKMVDTRWFWTVDDNLIKRWILIPELIIQSVVQTAKKMEKLLEEFGNPKNLS